MFLSNTSKFPCQLSHFDCLKKMLMRVENLIGTYDFTYNFNYTIVFNF